MGQTEILKFLEEHKERYFSVRELNKYLKANNKSITNSIGKLRENDEVNYKEVVADGCRKFIYKWKD